MMTATAVYSLMLAKHIKVIRDAGEGHEFLFKRLHRRSVLLNACPLLLGVLNLEIIARFAITFGCLLDVGLRFHRY